MKKVRFNQAHLDFGAFLGKAIIEITD